MAQTKCCSQPCNDGIDILQNTAQLNADLYQIRSALCACDGALCRLMHRGKNDLARAIGAELTPIASDTIQMRLELKRGKANPYLDAAGTLRQSALATLNRVRGEYAL